MSRPAGVPDEPTCPLLSSPRPPHCYREGTGFYAAACRRRKSSVVLLGFLEALGVEAVAQDLHRLVERGGLSGLAFEHDDHRLIDTDDALTVSARSDMGHAPMIDGERVGAVRRNYATPPRSVRRQ